MEAETEVEGRADWTRLYAELKAIAERWFRRQGAGHTLQPTALVHEAFLKLCSQEFHEDVHLLATAARAMRQVLVSHARAKGAQKRGGDWARVSLTQIQSPDSEPDLGLDRLEALLVRLEELHPRQAEIVELRFFGGLSVEQTARALGVSPRTVKLDWRMARAWIERELER